MREHATQVAVAGGGTAGHVTSGLAIMLAYRESFGAEAYFIGCPGGFEAGLVPARGFDLETIPGAPYERQNRRGKLRAVAELARGVARARALLGKRRTELLIGLGGYASAGAVIAARSLGIPTAIHEANVEPGRANGFLRRFAARVFVGWEKTVAGFPGSRTHVTGNPILPEIAGLERRADRRRILVMGGSAGSRFLNENAPPLLARLIEKGLTIEILHQSGGDARAVRDRYASLGIEAQVCSYIGDIAAAYRDAWFAISAAGALTLAELAAAGLPSLVVPMEEAANRHQVANAREFAAATGTLWIGERDWKEESIAERLASFLGDADALRLRADQLKKFARPDAARHVAALCEEMLGRYQSEYGVPSRLF